MKQVLRIILIYLTFSSSNSLFAQVQGKFGNTQSVLDVNAALEIESTSKGVLLPRLTTAQQNAMSAPTNGMLIYNTDSACFVLRRAGIWRSLCAANGGEAWSTLGNTGTNANTHFLGTTDNIPLSIRVNNQKAGRIDHLLNNAFWGYQAGNSITSGTDNVAMGTTALSTMTTGTHNVAIGGQSGLSNVTGVRNVTLGYSSGRNGTFSNSILIGYQAGLQNAASNNVFMGSLSGSFTNTGADNIALGYLSLFSNITGANNVAIGSSALTTVNGWGNTAVGFRSGMSMQIANANVAVGDSALLNNVLGSNNTMLGYRSGEWATGSNNIAIGYNAQLPVSTASNQLALGSWLYGTGGFLGINTINPQYKLDIDAQTGSSGNPLRLLGLSAGATSDSIISSSSGILRRLSINQILGNAWQLGGNAVVSVQNIGTSSNYALPFITNNTEWMRLNTTGSLGIGTTAPVYKVHVEEPSGYNADIAARLYNTNNLTFQPSLLLQTSGGTKAAPTAVANTTMLGVIRWGGYDGSAFNDVQSAEIGATATEAFTTTAHGTSLGFKTIPNTTTTALTRMTISQNGNVGIGTTSPNQQLEITAAMRMPATTTTTTGVIYKGANRFIHDYKPAANDGNNTFIGTNAGNFTMASATSWLASANTGVGAATLTALVDGGFNTAMGRNSMTAMTSGSYNVAVGSHTLTANTTGTSNTAIGHNALTVTTSSNNTAVGGSVLANNVAGYSNTSMGESSMNKNTSGNQNTAVGQAAMRENLTGSNNIGVGLSALMGNTSGSSNIAIGVSALVANTTTDGNTVVGHSAMSATTSASNVAIGYLAGTGTTTGGNNVFVGYQTGTTNLTGANNTLLGYQANVASNALTNATAIGNGATVNANNKIRLGNTLVTNVETYGSFTTISDRRLKTNINDNFIGLDFIKAVRPVQYELKAQKGIVYDGFIAQEIDSILTKLNIKSFSGVSKPENTEGGYYTVSYATFVVPLVNAVKELDALSEKLKVNSDKLAAENAALKAELERMKKDNGVLKASVDKNSQDIEAIKAALIKKQN